MVNNTVNWSPGITLEAIERQVILAAFRHFRGNKTATANSLGIAIRTLDNKLEKYEAEGKTEEKQNAQRLTNREEFLKRQRGFVSGPDGSITPIVERRIYSEPSPSYKAGKARGERPDQSDVENGEVAEAGVRMESASHAAPEQSLPLSVGSQVQSVSPKHAAGNRNGKRR